MQPSNALQRILLANFSVKDPGDAGTLVVDRDRFFYSLAPATTETRTLAAPPKAGLMGTIASIAAYTTTVSVLDSAAATTGTITFTSSAQWCDLRSYETTSGVFKWQVVDIYGATTTIATPSTVQSSVTATNLVVSTAASIASVLATNISGASMSVSSNLNAASILATNISAATGLTTPRIVLGQHAGMTGGTAASAAQAMTGANAIFAFTNATNNFYALPAPTVGLVQEFINRVGSTAVVVADNSTRSIQGATSQSIATSNAAGAASRLICDGTHWWKCPQ